MPKKTSVLLPGGIQGLVNDLQNGNSRFQPRAVVDEELAAKEAEEKEEKNVVNEPDDAEQYGKEKAEQAGGQAAGGSGAGQAGGGQATGGSAGQAAGGSAGAGAAGGQAGAAGEDGVETSQEPAGRGRRPKDPEVKTYNVVKDDSKDSWQLFVDMAQEYKQGGGKLATIYIDPTLKAVLDRLKYIGPEKFPTSAILSSIVARFIYDHEEEIKSIIYNQRLL